MKSLPDGHIETGRSVVRILASCVILCSTIILTAYGVLSSESSFSSTLKTAYADELGWFMTLATFAFFFLAAVLASVSLLLIFCERDRRDPEYGRLGLCIAAASLVLCLVMALLPAKAKARGTAGVRFKAAGLRVLAETRGL
jgi:choline-glycine betaine transporter